jgi:hypothetical protein
VQQFILLIVQINISFKLPTDYAAFLEIHFTGFVLYRNYSVAFLFFPFNPACGVRVVASLVDHVSVSFVPIIVCNTLN